VYHRRTGGSIWIFIAKNKPDMDTRGQGALGFKKSLEYTQFGYIYSQWMRCTTGPIYFDAIRNGTLPRKKTQNKAKLPGYKFKRISQDGFPNRTFHFGGDRKLEWQSNRHSPNRI